MCSGVFQMNGASTTDIAGTHCPKLAAPSVTICWTPLLTASAGSFVDNRLIAEQRQLSRLQLPISADSAEHIIISQDDGHWRSDSAALSSDTLKALVDGWQHAYALQVRHLSTDELSGLPQPQVRLWFEDDSTPLDLIIQANAQTLQVISPVSQLQYDFPLAVQSQLLPQQPAKP